MDAIYMVKAWTFANDFDYASKVRFDNFASALIFALDMADSCETVHVWDGTDIPVIIENNSEADRNRVQRLLEALDND